MLLRTLLILTKEYVTNVYTIIMHFILNFFSDLISWLRVILNGHYVRVDSLVNAIAAIILLII